jgi:uncharacterized protein involved in exopolysaccharide biosynthesis
MSDKTPQIIRYIPYQPIEDDEIDLKEIIKTILKYKKFIIILTLILTFLAVLYTFLKTPVYEVKADIKLGHIIYPTQNGITTIYLLDPKSIVIYIKNTYDNNKNPKIKFPQINTSLVKTSKDIVNIQIYNTSNQKALNNLKTIINDLKSKEQIKIKSYIQNIKAQISTLEKQKQIIKHQINIINSQLKNVKEADIVQMLLITLNNYQNKILKINLQISKLKSKISPINISQTHVLGKILTLDKPVKPKKVLIIIVVFITGLILSIFLAFLIEFIKGLKEE